jgi:ankyrin repeat protein
MFMMKKLQGPIAVSVAAMFILGCVIVTTLAAKWSAYQQEKANSTLLGLWWNPRGPHDRDEGANVTVERVKAALDDGANIEARLELGGDTSLMLAAYHGNLECVKFLVSRGANVNAKSPGGWTALNDAVISRNLACVKFLVSQGADVNATATIADVSVLAQAIYTHKIDCVKYLVTKGADVNAKNRHGWTPLMVSAYLGRIDCVKVFIANGAEVNAKADNGETALSLAARHPQIVAILTAAGAR